MGQSRIKQERREQKQQRFNSDLYSQITMGMTDKEKKEMDEKFKPMSDHMFNHIDYESNSLIINDPTLSSCAAQIKEALKSGLHPSYLTGEERAVMEELDGKEWEKKWL